MVVIVTVVVPVVITVTMTTRTMATHLTNRTLPSPCPLAVQLLLPAREAKLIPMLLVSVLVPIQPALYLD